MSPVRIRVALFRLGRIVATSNALHSVSTEEILKAIQRHQAGDWGNLDTDDRNSNDGTLVSGGRIFSAYVAHDGIKFWIITEADRGTVARRNCHLDFLPS